LTKQHSPQPRHTPAPAAKAPAPSAAPADGLNDMAEDRPEWPKLVHAYRRLPHVVHNPRTGLDEERPVEVVFMGEKVKFMANPEGHIVGEVHTEATYNRLIKEIPEAYIPYRAGENVPEVRVLADEHKREEKPDGQFVLTSTGGDGVKQYKVLDGMNDDELRAFAAECGLTEDQTPDVLEGEVLQRAIYNLLGGE
jgi:hypothetical protein